MKTSRLVVEIDRAIERGKLHEPFRGSDVRAACPGFAHTTYCTFLPKHTLNNPDNNKVHFEKVGAGLYRRLPRSQRNSAPTPIQSIDNPNQPD